MLNQAIDLLEMMASGRDMTFGDLARRTGLPNASAHRILQTLGTRGLAQRDSVTQTWGLGPGSLRLASSFLRRDALTERAQPVLQALAREQGETASLGLMNGDEILTLSHVEPEQAIRVSLPLGHRAPMHSSGIGKAMLASLSSPELSERLARLDLAALTPQTLTDISALRRELAATARRGFAVDDEETVRGMRSIAAPIRGGAGEVVGGVSLCAPACRVSVADLSASAAALLAASSRLSAMAGEQTQYFLT